MFVYDTYVYETLDGTTVYSDRRAFAVQDTDTGECWGSLVAWFASFDYELSGSAGLRTYVFGPIHRHVYGH